MKRLLQLVLIAALLAGVSLIQGCAFVAGAAVGGTAAYVLHEDGYRVQSPIKK